MRFHVLGLAHTRTIEAESTCAYTQKVRNFCRMMMGLGHEVYLYSSEENDAPCTEHIACIDEKTRLQHNKGQNTLHREDAPHWIVFNANAIAALETRVQVGDFLCVIFGMAQRIVAHEIRTPMAVEYGIGYHFTFAQRRVFESYAWMHSVYAVEAKTSDRDGVFYDDVIHGYYDPALFTFSPTKKDYVLYLGRMIERKGVRIAAQAAEAAGKDLVCAGPGDCIPKGVEYIGEVGPESRRKLLAEASAVLMPTVYIEPFGNVAIEAMASGTPVITTDWGAFTETVRHGITGFRCRILQEFVDAIHKAPTLDPFIMEAHADANFSLRVTGPKYERYFKRLQTLWGAGWGQLRDDQ